MKEGNQMKKFYKGYVCLPFDVETDKAVGFTVNHGHIGRGHNTKLWLPKSQLVIGDPEKIDEATTIAEVKIPAWLLDKNNVTIYQINEIRIGNGEDVEVWEY